MLTQKRGKQTRGKRLPKSRMKERLFLQLEWGWSKRQLFSRKSHWPVFADPGHIYPPIRDSQRFSNLSKEEKKRINFTPK